MARKKVIPQCDIPGVTRVRNKHPLYPEYTAWCNMFRRVYTHPDYKNIKICDRWFSFRNFVNDMGKKPKRNYSLERYDCEGDYCPENCGWASYYRQNENRKNIKYYRCGGIVGTIAQFARLCDFEVISTLYRRLYKNKKAVLTPSRCDKRKRVQLSLWQRDDLVLEPIDEGDRSFLFKENFIKLNINWADLKPRPQKEVYYDQLSLL